MRHDEEGECVQWKIQYSVFDLLKMILKEDNRKYKELASLLPVS